MFEVDQVMCRCLHANPRELLKRPNMRAARIGPHRMNLRHAVGSFLHPHRTALHLPSRVFADSTRPGVLVGPYASPAPFIAEYAAYRNRPILAFRELDSYQRKLATKQSRQDRNR